jgi:hypothetical protein
MFSSLSTYYFTIILLNSLASLATNLRDYGKCFPELGIKQVQVILSFVV